MDDKDLLDEAKSLFSRAKDAWSEIYQEAQNDLYFLSDVPGSQWDQRAYDKRLTKGKPALEMDQLDKYINQVVNEERMSTPTINIIPDGAGSAKEDAEAFQGIIRNIEYQSDADTAYDTGAESAVKCSLGFIGVDHEFEEDSFNQRLKIRRIVNPLSVYLDPESIEIDGSDAMYAFEIEIITAKEFKKLYPEKAPVSFSDEPNVKPANRDEQSVTLVQLYKIEEVTQQVGTLDGINMEPVQDGIQYLQTRKITKRIVRRYRLSGQDVLAETTFPGRYIPLVPVYGREMWRDGKRYLLSLIRKAKPAQQMYNMMKSLEVELIMRQPRSNFMASSAAIENYANDWKNPENVAVLQYNHVDEAQQPIPQPTPLPPPQYPVAIGQAAQEAVQAIKDATGIYDAALGMKSNETSGIAIQRRQQEGDVATFHFADNRVKSICQVGRVLLFAIPEIYDTARVTQIIDQEENPKLIGVNGAMAEGQEKPINLNKGKFTVKVTTGASFTTRRQEAAQLMGDAIKAAPQLMQVMGDLYFENMDMPGAQEIANRLKKTMPPNLVDGDDKNPEVANLQAQLQQATQALQALQAQLAQANKETQQKDAELAIKAKDVDNKAQLGAADIQLKEKQLVMDAQMKQIDMQEKQIELEIKQIELKIKEIEAASKLQAAHIQSENSKMELFHNAIANNQGDV